ncbi:MAG: AAA family ATPase [Planctomycetes bacterium]|nr:AAA family ATPase [Planctomycetota bacterium]
MYEAHWGLERPPFQNKHDAEFFYPGSTHQASLLKLRYAIDKRLGAGLLSGGVGYGKTFLVHVLCRELGESFAPIVQVLYPQLAPAELLRHIAVELGAAECELLTIEDDLGASPARQTAGRGVDRVVRAIERELRRHAAEGRRPLIVVDDAHLIEDPRVFQALHLILNFQQHAGVEFTLLVVGERAVLGQVGRIPQLNERIGITALLRPLGRAETSEYVEHRLHAAGAQQTIFRPDALEALFELSGGVPRKINRLCDLALLVGYADGLNSLSADEIEAVADELVAVVH